MRHAPGIALAVAVQLVAATASAGPPVAPVEEAVVAEPLSEGDGEGEPAAEREQPDDTMDAAKPGPTPEELMFAAKVEEAAKHYGEGKALMSEGRYTEAAAEYERSHASIEFGDTLFKIIEAYEAANEPIKALKKARAYIALDSCDGGRESPANYPCAEPEQREAAIKKSNRLRQLVGELKLQLGKDVVLRGVKVADKMVPLDDFPLLVLPGSFIVELTGPKDGQRRSYEVTVDAGETFNVFVPPWEKPRVLDPIGGGGDDGDDEQTLEEQRRRKRILKGAFWGGVGLTTASGALLGVVGGLARYHQQRFNTEHCGGLNQTQCMEQGQYDPDSDSYYPSRHERLKERYLVATNAMIGVTAALGVTTVVLGIFAFTKKKPSGANARVQVRADGLTFRW